MIRIILILTAIGALVGAAMLAGDGLNAQDDAGFTNSEDTRAALSRAEKQAQQAAARGEELEAAARTASEAAEKTAREAAALAARIQQAEAGIQAAEARLTLIDGQRQQLNQRLAVRQEPLIRLTGALQKMARRPLTLSALRPGSLRETVYLRAMLETTVPEVRSRTAALRAEIDRGRVLKREANQALAALRGSESELNERRQQLAALETQQRLTSRRVGGAAAREAERALALAEEARDLDSLVGQLDQAGNLRTELAALPGPVMRPANPSAAPRDAALAGNTASPTPTPATSSAGAAPAGFQLPVTGRTLTGFGEAGTSGVRNTGISLAPVPGAQVIAPAAGRVAFAGPYRGFDRIVILEHSGGWTSLVTGLARSDVEVGETLLGGAPLGIAKRERPVVTLELRRAGKPVNPVNFLN